MPGEPIVTSRHEITSYLRHHSLSDSCFYLRKLDRNRQCSVRWAFNRFADRELWMEHSCQSKIDGRTVANVVQGRRYDHVLPAGRHVLTVSAVPNSYYSEPTSTVLNARPGHTYVFTGSWDGSNRVVLIPSALPPGQSY